MGNYDDIRNLPYRKSTSHPPMSLRDRAAQFAPFAALSGYDDMVRETARLTAARAELSEDEKAVLDREMRSVSDALRSGRRPRVSVSCFVPDEKKEGGRYESYEGTVRRIDTVRRILVLDEEDPGSMRREIGFGQIMSIRLSD